MAGFLALGTAGDLTRVDAVGVAARATESGEYLELTTQGEPGSVNRVPLYQSGGLRYFSAGVGIEERMASYPAYSLKMVFTAGGRPFLTGVAVTIHPADGGPPLVIPQDHVNGPWLFVDLPAGRYDVTATYGHSARRVTGVAVQAGTQRTIHLQWGEDRGLPANGNDEGSAPTVPQ